jgi:hypothetical protein
MYEWLFEFEKSLMTGSPRQITDTLRDLVEKREFDKTYPTMRLLREIVRKSVDCKESAEAWAYCGVTAWLMESKQDAVEYLRQARTQYIPSSHQHAVISWMLGLIQISMPTNHGKAISNMENAVECFEVLRKEAIRQNQTAISEWYQIHHKAMKRVLNSMIVTLP